VSRLHGSPQFRQRLYGILDQGSGVDRFGVVVNWTLIGLIVVTLTATVPESVPRLAAQYGEAFEAIEYTALVTFSIEYAARLWTAIEHPRWRRFGAIRSRLRLAASPAGLIDLVAVLPFWPPLFLAADFKALLVLRLVRFFKLTRYSPAMRSLLEALYTERRALVGCFVILCGATLIAAALMHLAEGAAKLEKFGTIPDAMWWAIVTLGMVGYGDAVPITAAGRLVAGLTIFVGLLMVALAGILLSPAGWWQGYPPFSELTAVQIGDVMKILRAQKADRGTVIARRGEPAHSMYLIVDGEVEIKLRPKHVHPGAGDFFGEVAALRQFAAFRDGCGAAAYASAGARCVRPARPDGPRAANCIAYLGCGAHEVGRRTG
jgi:voltage-gated potassium channel